MWKIGNLSFENKVVLAPMAGITSFGYRKFMEQFGISLSFSEMISDMGLIYNNKETLDYLDYPETDVQCAVQLFGSDVENLVKAAKIVQKSIPFLKIIDINMGCPVPKVTKTGAGSSLLSNPQKISEIIRRIKEETGLLVTAKIRLGISQKTINFLEVIEALEKGGCDAISLHARTAKDLYSGTPNFELCKNLRSKMKIPLIISGNIFSCEDAKKALEITGADAVMVARGAIGNPHLIKEINHYLKTGEKLTHPSFEKQKEYCLELAKFLIEEKGENTAMRIYRGIAPKFFSGFPFSKQLKLKLSTQLKDYKSLCDILNNVEII